MLEPTEPLLAVDRSLFKGEPCFTSEQVAAAAGVDPELATRLWRAMGFTESAPEQVAFYREDAEALKMANYEISHGTPIDVVLRQTRVMNAAMSRLAESIGEDMVAAVRAMRDSGVSDEETAGWLVEGISPDRFEHLLGYFLRRQLRGALWRKLAVPADAVGGPSLTVGFVDLVRFTAITEEVAEEELDHLVTRFEEVSHEHITNRGGRMVKMIGDEVMFVADEPAVGAAIALDLVEAYSHDEQLPPARAGVACGTMLSRDGDYFGQVVNLASRIVDVARPAAVVTSEPVHDELHRDATLSWRRLPPKRLKGIGRPALWSVRRARKGG